MKSSGPPTTTGRPEQPTMSVLGDLNESYVVRRPGILSIIGTDTGPGHEEWGSLGPSLPDALGPVVPVHSISPIPPKRAFSPYRFEVLQQWEGTVTSLGGGEFVAKLTDLTDPSQLSEEAVFSRQELSDGDLPLLVEGAVFRWAVGYKTRGGQKERVSNISFLRLPAWSRNITDAIKEAAAELERAFPPTDPS